MMQSVREPLSSFPRDSSRAGQPIYTPSKDLIEHSQLTAFTRVLEQETGKKFPTYQALHDYSTAEFRSFWSHFLRWSGLVYEGPAEPACIGDDCETATFFPGVLLNYAENLLRYPASKADEVVVTSYHAGACKESLTRRELLEKTMCLAQALEQLGVSVGDRVAAIMRNDASALVTALAVAAVGATLSTAAPEMGAEAILSRLGPLSPKLLIAHASSRTHDTGISICSRIAEVASGLPSFTTLITLDGELTDVVGRKVYSAEALLSKEPPRQFAWKRFPFNHPLFVMFSSGTTGKPKCIVHGTGGTLLEHVKEHRLHCDLREGDTLYFQTSCAWMMWNWQMSALAPVPNLFFTMGPSALQKPCGRSWPRSG